MRTATKTRRPRSSGCATSKDAIGERLSRRPPVAPRARGREHRGRPTPLRLRAGHRGLGGAMSGNDHVAEPFRSLLNDLTHNHRAARAELRDGMAALNRVNRQTMSYIGPAPEDEDELEADAEVERLHTEVARQESIIADLQEALTKIAEIAGDYGDGAPDDHYLAHILLQLEANGKTLNL